MKKKLKDTMRIFRAQFDYFRISVRLSEVAEEIKKKVAEKKLSHDKKMIELAVRYKYETDRVDIEIKKLNSY
jgi:hypothetical protein